MDELKRAPSTDNHGESTIDMFDLAADELAAKEMEQFLMSVEKNDIGDILKKDLKKKLEAATAKLNDLFKQQQALSMEEELDQSALEKELTLLAAAQGEEKAKGKADHMRNLLLQKRVTALNNQVELSEQKARSVTIQWAMDREKYKSEIKQKLAEVEGLQTKLVVVERKARLHEQLSRDSNMVKGTDGNAAFDTEDVDQLREMLLVAQGELADKRKLLAEVSRDLYEAKTELAGSIIKNELLATRVEDLVKSADADHDHLENMEKDEANLAKQLKSLQENLQAHMKDLRSEQQQNAKLEAELVSQQAHYEGKIAAMNLTALTDKIKALEAAIIEQKSIFAEKERDLKKMADHSRLEKEQIARENKQLTAAINKVAYMTKTITAEFEAHKGAVDSRLDADTKKSQTMYAELKALSNSIDSVAGDASKRSKDMETRLEQQKMAADAAELEYEKERERLELRILDMQKDFHAKEKGIKAKIAAATQVETAAKEAAQKELNTANSVIDKLNKEIDTIKRRGGSVGASKDAAEKYVTELEAEKDEYIAKVDAKNTTIAQLKKELADAAAEKEARRAELEAERERVEELESELASVKVDLEIAEDKLGSSAPPGPMSKGISTRNLTLQSPKGESDGAATPSQARELIKLKEELQNTKKELAAKQKEVKALQKEEKKVVKKDESKVATTPGGATTRKRAKKKTTDSDSDSDGEKETSAVPTTPAALGRKNSTVTSTTTTTTTAAETDLPVSMDAEPPVQPEKGTSAYASYMEKHGKGKKKGKAAGSQTDAFIAAANVDKKRVDAILRESILTDNFYYNKATSKFSNVYPIEEHLMEDLVDSFHGLSQNMLQVLRGVTGHGVSILESSKKEEFDAKQLVNSIEAMILKAGQDLIVNLEKSKERNLKKMMAEHKAKSENPQAGPSESDLAEAKAEAVAEATRVFEQQLQELRAERARLDDKLVQTFDLLEQERTRTHEAEDRLAEALEQQAVVVGQEDGGMGVSKSFSKDDDSLGSNEEEEEEDELGMSGDALASASGEAVGADGAVSAAGVAGESGSSAVTATDTTPSTESKKGLSFKTVTSVKQKVVALRKKQDSRKNEKAEELMEPKTGSPGPPGAGAGNNSGKGHTPKTKRTRKTLQAKFDDLDTGSSIFVRLSDLQKEELKTMLLLDLTDEVKQNLLDAEVAKAQKLQADSARNHHVMRDVNALKDDLVQGKLQNIGEVQISDFDRLRNKLFGGDDLISLTIVEHHIEYGGPADMYDLEDAARQQNMTKEEARKDALKKRQYRMLIRSMTLQRELLTKNVLAHTSLLDLLRFKHSTETALAQLAALSAWRALNYYRKGGVFRDVLEVHLGVIDRCISIGGGWQKALAEIEDSPNPPLAVDTAQWPEFFRVRVLEVLRNRIAEELERTKVQLSLANSMPQGQTTFIPNNDVLSFGQAMETEANKKRVDELRESASMKAEHIMAKDDVHGINRSIRKLQAKADASFERFSSKRGGFEQDSDDEDSIGGNAVKAKVIRAGFSDSNDEADMEDSLSSKRSVSTVRAGAGAAAGSSELGTIAEEGRTNTLSSIDSAALAGDLSNVSSKSQVQDVRKNKAEEEGGVESASVAGHASQTTIANAQKGAKPTKSTQPKHPSKNNKPALALQGPPSDVLSQLVGDLGDDSEPPTTADADESVVSQLSMQTRETLPSRQPPPPAIVPASTKAQAARVASKKMANSLKFDKYDMLKKEEKKRKAAKEAENLKAAGDSMKILASSLGDMFPAAEEDAVTVDNEDDQSKQSKVQPVSHDAENLLWMVSAADKLVMSGLYGDERAQQLMHCIVDAVSSWMANQAPTAAMVFTSALPMGLVPELLTELAHRAKHKPTQVPPVVLEIREKFDNILAYIAQSAAEAQAREHAFIEMHSPHRLKEPLLAQLPPSAHPHGHSGALTPHLPVHHSHPHGHAAAPTTHLYMNRTVHDNSSAHPSKPFHYPAHSPAGHAASQHDYLHAGTHSYGAHHSTLVGQPHLNHAHPHPRSASPVQHDAHTAAQVGHGGAVHVVNLDGSDLSLPVYVPPVGAVPYGVPHTLGHRVAHHGGGHHPAGHHDAGINPSPHSPDMMAYLQSMQVAGGHLDLAHHSGHGGAGGASVHPHHTPVHTHGVHYAAHVGQGHDASPAGHSSPLPHVYYDPHAVPQLGDGSSHPSAGAQTQASVVQTTSGSDALNSTAHPFILQHPSASQHPHQPSPYQQNQYLQYPQQHIGVTSHQAQHPHQPGNYPVPGPHPGSLTSYSTAQSSVGTTPSNVGGEQYASGVQYNSEQGPIYHSAVHRKIYSPGQVFTVSKPGTSTHIPRKRVVMFENSTQTAHGSIELHDLSTVNEEGNNTISTLVRALMLDGWDEKAKAAIVGKKKDKEESHTIITSALAVPASFVQEHIDPFAQASHVDAPPVYKGFEHAYFDETEFEVLPGVRLASAHRVAAAIRAKVFADREKERSKAVRAGVPLTTSSTPLDHEDDLHIGSWIMSTNVRYCIRTAGADYGTRLKKAPAYINAPVVPGCEAVIFPNVFPVQQGVNLVTGEGCRLGGNVALPEDVLLLQLAEDSTFPHGLTRVELAPKLKLSSSLQQFLQREHALPTGHQLVQLTQHSAVTLPPGVEVTSGVTIAATPPEFDLPSNVILVKNPFNDDLPSFMHKLDAVTNEEDDLIAAMKLNEFCCIIKRPNGVDFGLGVEILQRPPGHALPPGMTLLDKDAYPDGLVLPEELELVQLTPRFDFPLGCRISAEWKVWPRPDGMRLPPGVQIVYPDSTAAVPKLPPGVCATNMPDIPYGVTLPPNCQAVEIFGAAAGKFPLPEGSILAPGITVLNSDELMPRVRKSVSTDGMRSTRALNVLLVHRLPGTQLPPLVERGSKADLPVGTLLSENMDIVRVAVRFELPAGVRIQAGAQLGQHTQIAPGTDLVTLSGGKPDDHYSSTLRVLEWPHGVSLTPGTEFVRRPPAGYYLPVGYKEVIQPQDVRNSSTLGAIPDYGMLVQLPRSVHYATAQNLAEQVTVGLESLLEGKLVTLPLGMVLASRKSRQSQWPAEMTTVPKSALSVNLTRVIDKVNSENSVTVLRDGSKNVSFASDATRSPTKKETSNSHSPHIEVVKLKAHYALPPGCEIVPGVVVQRKPFWLHAPSGVELVTKYTDSEGHLLPFPCRGVVRVQMRPDYIVTGADIDTVTARRGSIWTKDGIRTPSASARNSPLKTVTSPSKLPAPTSGRKDWELIDLENTLKLSPTSLPDNVELVYVSELLDQVHNWGPYLKGVEAVSRSSPEVGPALVLPPRHHLIHRPRIPVTEALPDGFKLNVSSHYSSWPLPTLPPNILIMHLVPTYQLPMGINMINTSVLSKTQFNTLLTKGGLPGDYNVPQLQSGEHISSGFSVIEKPFGSVAMSDLLKKDPFYAEEAHAFVRVHDPRHFKVPEVMTLDRHSDEIVENVFGKELSWAWRKGYVSLHDSDAHAEAVRSGELLITDVIKLVRLPHGFPPPRERQKRAQVRFALRPIAHKVQLAVKALHAFSDSQQGTPTKSDAPLAVEENPSQFNPPASLPHPDKHNHKKKASGGLLVYPRLLCVHKRDKAAGEHEREKYLVNYLLNRLNKPPTLAAASGSPAVTPVNGSIDRKPQFNAGLAPIRTALFSYESKDAALHEDALARLQDNLEESNEENTTNRNKIISLEADRAVLAAGLKEAVEKNHQYEKQLSYDEDLKVLIHRLNMMLKQRAEEIDQLKNADHVEHERLQAQVEVLNVQVAYYQDLSEQNALAIQTVSETSIDTKNADSGGTALSIEHLEKFSSSLHQKYRDQMLSGLEKMSDLYAGSVNKIMGEFESVLVHWPHWSPRELMIEAVAWSKNKTISARPSAYPSSHSLLSLDVPAASPHDAQSMNSYLLTPPKFANNNLAVKVRDPTKGNSVSIDDDISVLSDGESSSIIVGDMPDVGYTGASLAGTEANSLSSGYQARDLTKDEHGRPVPITESFPLGVKAIYHHPIAPDPNVTVLSITSPVSLSRHTPTANQLARRKREAPVDPSKYLHRTVAHFGELPEIPAGEIELSHSLNDLFAKQRRTRSSGKGPFSGKLPKLIHNTTVTPSTKQDDAESVRPIQYFDPAVLGSGVSVGAASRLSHTQPAVGGGGGGASVVVTTEEGMTVTADITAQQVAEFIKNDEHRAELRRKLHTTTSTMSETVRKEFTALLMSVHSAVVSSIPVIIEQYSKETGNDTSRGVGSSEVLMEDYARFSASSLMHVQDCLDLVTKDSAHLMKYALGGVLLHADVALQRQDIECDVLRHKLLMTQKRAEMLDHLLQEARHKATGDSQNEITDSLKEKVVSLEGRLDRLQGLHVDPAVSVLATLVQRLGDISELAKQLKFTALLFKQKAAQTESRIQASHDYNYQHAHEQKNNNSSTEQLGESDDDVDDELSIGSNSLSINVDREGSLTRSKKRTKPASVQLSTKDVKALKHYAHGMRMKARHCHARAHVIGDECSDLMKCIMEHMEAYQRAAQKLLPAPLLDQVLRASTRKYQDISAGQKLNRVRAAVTSAPSGEAYGRPSPKATSGGVATTTVRLEKLQSAQADTSSVASSEVPLSILSPMTNAGGGSGGSVSGSVGGQSVKSFQSATGSGRNVLKSVRPSHGDPQRGLIDATRTIAQSNVRFGAAGSLPMAPVQSHLLLRGAATKQGKSLPTL